MDVLCTGKNMDGERCTRHRSPGKTWCPWHNPADIERRARKLEQRAAALRATLVEA